MVSSTPGSNLWDDLLRQGQVTVTQEQVRDRSGSSAGSVQVAVAEAQRRHLLFSLVKGVYGISPSKHRHDGAVPVDWFLDDLCPYLERNYYREYLSAAARHGASHQAAQQTAQRPRAATRRLGFLFESVKSEAKPSALEAFARTDRDRSLLDPKKTVLNAID